MKEKNDILILLNLFLLLLVLFGLGFLWGKVGGLENQIAALSSSLVPSKPLPPAPVPTLTPQIQAPKQAVAEVPAAPETPLAPAVPMPTPGVAGADWEEVNGGAPFGPRREIELLVFKDKLWVIGGLSQTDVWCSDDGEHWTQTCPDAGFATGVDMGVVFRDKMWVMSDGGVWNSGDGRHWSKVAGDLYGERRNASLVAFQNKLWMIGGGNWMSNDVWVSSNGTDWKCAVPSAPFPPRRAHISFVFNDRLWVLSGMGGDWSNLLRDCWSSADGIHWTREASTPFMARCAFSFAVAGGKIWVIGGDGGNFRYLNDVWVSPEGTDWKEVVAHAGFSNRGYHHCTVFKGRIWLLTGDRADVWCTPPRGYPAPF